MSVSVACCLLDCGVLFSLPDHVYNQAKGNPKRQFYCPNGHQQHFTPDRVAELEQQVDRLRGTINRLEERALRDERRIAYWRGRVTLLKRRRR